MNNQIDRPKRWALDRRRDQFSAAATPLAWIATDTAISTNATRSFDIIVDRAPPGGRIRGRYTVSFSAGATAGAMNQSFGGTIFGSAGSPSYAGVMIWTPYSLNTSRMLRCMAEYIAMIVVASVQCRFSS